MEGIDSAFIQFQTLIKEIETYDHTIFSEQDTRVKVIDRIFTKVFGYDLADLLTEPGSGTGFIDYQILIKGVGKLVIEAKRDGLDFEIEPSYSGRGYNLDGPMFKNKVLKEGIAQTIYYAAQESIELGCLTNGKTWIIFRANRMGDGKKVSQGKGIVFSSLKSISEQFKLFYELLSPKSIEDLTYRAIFQELEGQEIRAKDFTQALKTEETIKLYENDDKNVLNGADVKIILVGKGERKAELEAIAAADGSGLVEFFGQQPKEIVMAALKHASAGYISLKSEPIFRFGVSPNKLWDYMLVALPVIFACQAGNDPVGDNRCGVSTDPESADSIASAILQLAQLSANERVEMGTRGRDAVLQ
ncbi:MAG: glycosyltransferase, partial [Flavobacterium sp.]